MARYFDLGSYYSIPVLGFSGGSAAADTDGVVLQLRPKQERREGKRNMWRKVVGEGAARLPWLMTASRRSFSSSSSSKNMTTAVNSFLLRSLKEHYQEVSKMNPPPKTSPPPAFTIIKGALDGDGPVLTSTYGKEEIKVTVLRMSKFLEGDDEDDINNLFIHVDVSKPSQENSLQFLCGLFPDALGLHAVSLRSKLETGSILETQSTYSGPLFEDLDEKMKDAFHNFLEERGVNESLFNFLRAWLYVKDHRNLLRWFKTVGTYINES